MVDPEEEVRHDAFDQLTHCKQYSCSTAWYSWSTACLAQAFISPALSTSCQLRCCSVTGTLLAAGSSTASQLEAVC